MIYEHVSSRDDTSPLANPYQKEAASTSTTPSVSRVWSMLSAITPNLLGSQNTIPSRVDKEDSADSSVRLQADKVSSLKSPTFRRKLPPNPSDWPAFCSGRFDTIPGKLPTLTEFAVQLQQSHAAISNISLKSHRSSSVNSDEYQEIETRLDEVSARIAALSIRLDELHVVTFLSLELLVLLADRLQLDTDFIETY